MIAEGLQLMLIGMGVVFLFLTILVMLMTLTGAIVRRIQPMTAAASGMPPASGGTSAMEGGVPMGVVLAAVGAHHNRRTAAHTTTGDTK
jgi:oxaloacetate decarboxylase (Na+ extruding) subunit gamma